MVKCDLFGLLSEFLPLLCKTSPNLNIGWCHSYVHMPLLSAQLIFVHMRERLHLPAPPHPLKCVSIH